MYQVITREAVRSLKFARRYKIYQKEKQTELILHNNCQTVRTTHPISIILLPVRYHPYHDNRSISSISTIKISISFL
ncbi:hypothetical protein RIR_jg11739.t1 [Rhizophagus irregularis DAOM 181602=DAOM 197198]|uniref:Uncharacterized protein n=1 Tax=Rhizophagus irregularis (strain DAOM 181602 / DAOM 197198 / MUCL 43194) TaxID=747089 RepID=U9UWB2_RHIID|nr:hypothetical protein RIR_jg11739.t1 [Rhizophagus irregularis DAOM 181602=DAOM 197198]